MKNPSEQRKQTRFYGLFPMLVRMTNVNGNRSLRHTLADNISEGGLYMQLPHLFETQKMLFALIELPSGAKLAVHGIVLRSEVREDQLFGFAVQFMNSRLFNTN